MVRIAEQLARRSGAQALVTGDVVGQVASQTIENLAVVEAAATMPVLRPLIGFDKDEITAQAQRLGTYETSIISDEDCCTLFTPPFPSTRATREGVERAEAALDLTTLVAEAVEATVVEDFRYPLLKKPGVILRNA
jgi:thiamine biosynthesis protein ThiI